MATDRDIFCQAADMAYAALLLVTPKSRGRYPYHSDVEKGQYEDNPEKETQDVAAYLLEQAIQLLKKSHVGR